MIKQNGGIFIKQVLLIAGGGTLGSYTSLELLKMGAAVDVIALEELPSFDQHLTYIRERVSDELLQRLFAEKHYDAIVDFLHYPDIEQYKSRFELLASNTEHYFFLSSYRVYADQEHPLKESSPQLIDVYGEAGLLQYDTYGIAKSHAERHIRASAFKNWTILRPLISFSHFRFDLVTLGGRQLFPRAAAHKKVLLPADAKNQTAGVGWAGNAGKLIARLIFNPRTRCEDYIIGHDENLTWGQVAEIYSDVMGLEFVWVDTEDYLSACTPNGKADRIILYHDRLYDRLVDNEKVRAATGTRREELVGFRDALIYELTQLNAKPELVRSFTDSESALRFNRQMDEWLQKHEGKEDGQ